MKAVVVYDSKFGNTERLALIIANRLSAGEPVTAVAAADAGERDLMGADMLVLGSPTQGHGISPAMRAFLARISSDAVRNLPVATFDTRLRWPRVLSGSAAAGCARRLGRKGAHLLVPPESFLVMASEGPLAEGELARAGAWAETVRATAAPLEPSPVAAAL